MDLNNKHKENALNTLQEISMEEIKLPVKYIHNDLNQEVWDGVVIKPEILNTLKKIAKDFYDFLKIDAPIEGMWFTGSLANYNWSNYSDIDLHVLVDYKKINKDIDLVTEYLASKKDNWNNLHDIKIKGFDVELYAQDVNEEHRSSGVYDIENNSWLRKPSKENPSINKSSIKKKIKSFIDKIEKIESIKDFEESQEKGKSLKDKIKKMRKTGLEKSGEFSEENLVFKYLRNNGFISRLFDKIRNSYDKSVSINEVENDYSFDYNEKSNKVDSEQLVNIVKALHKKNKENFDENLIDKIKQFDHYELITIPISIINLSDLNLDDDLVSNYLQKTLINPDYPPIIFNPINKEIIDGAHRTEALIKLGHDTIRAYVGVESRTEIYESIRSVIRQNISEFFSSAGFHASMEDWIKKWQKKGVDLDSDSYGSGMDMGIERGALLSEEDNNTIVLEGKSIYKRQHKDFRNINLYSEKKRKKTKKNMKENFNPFYIDNLEKLKQISKIVFGMTGDEEMAGNMLLDQSNSLIYIPLDMYMEDKMVENLVQSLQRNGYNISNINSEEIEVDLAEPIFSLNESHNNFYTLAPKKHQLMFEKNLEDEHGDNVEDFKRFISFCCKEGKISHPTVVHLRGTRDENLKTTASYNPGNHHVHIYCKGRHKVDIMRSLAHELMHMIQMLENRLNDNSGNDGSPEENEAHSFAGLMIRKFGKIKPEIYEGYNNKNKNII
jgi:ribosomal protein L17